MEGPRREYSREERFYQVLFALLSRVGRPFGGIRPRRWTHRVAQKAYWGRPPGASEFKWHADRWGSEMLLHPYYAMDYEIMAFGTYGEGVQRLIEARLRPGMVFFDLGANIGSVSLHAAWRVGPAGQVHSFEPVPALVDRLTANVSRNRLTEVIRVHPLAVSNASGKTKINIAGREVNNQGRASLVDAPAAFAQVEVETITLDEFVLREGIEHIDLIKVDIEGAEPLMIQGAQKVLNSPEAPDLIVECNYLALAPSGMKPGDLVAMIEECGYEIHALEETGRPGQRLVAAEIPPASFYRSLLHQEPGGEPGATRLIRR